MVCLEPSDGRLTAAVTWFSDLVAVAGVSFFLLRGFSAPATNPWLGCWFLVEELKIYILNIMEALFCCLAF